MQHPILTLGDGLGSRVVLHEGSSTHSGSYVVEECDSDEGGEGVRLIFLNSQHLAQTEVSMVPGTWQGQINKLYMYMRDCNVYMYMYIIISYKSHVCGSFFPKFWVLHWFVTGCMLVLHFTSCCMY